MAEDADERARRMMISRGCERRLSGLRPRTMREQLDAIADGPIDLDAMGDRYGDGPVAVLEQRVAALLGQPAACYFPTGTMAQQVALRCWAARSGNATVALHPLAHPEVHERYAYSTLTGLRAVWPTREPRQPTVAEIRDLDEPFGTLMLELPLREPGHLLPTWDELLGLVGAARERGARVHFDGARVWESTVYLGQDLATIAGLADSVYVSFYKTLGALAGAALSGPADVMAEARAWRHRYGGTLAQQWPAVVTALAGLDAVLPRIPSYVEHARTVADALARVPGARIHPSPPHTHEFQLCLPYPADRLNRATVALAEEEKTWFAYGWTDRPPTGASVVEISVTEAGLAWTADDVERTALAVIDRASSGE
jgi:threonine aldolase